MTWRIWSPVGSTSSSNASFETSFSSGAASALDDEEKRQRLRSGRLPCARSGSCALLELRRQASSLRYPWVVARDESGHRSDSRETHVARITPPGIVARIRRRIEPELQYSTEGNHPPRGSW